MPPKHMTILAALIANPLGLFGSDFKHYGISRWSIYGHLETLEEAGLITSEMLSGKPLRRTIHWISPAGQIAHRNEMQK